MKNFKKLLAILITISIIGMSIPVSFADSLGENPDELNGYLIGNSLTRSISPERFKELFSSQYYNLTTQFQGGAGVSMDEHVGLRSVTDPDYFIPWMRPFQTDKVTGEDIMRTAPMNAGSLTENFSIAFKQKAFDFVMLQPFGYYVETPEEKKDLINIPVETGNPDYPGEYYRDYYMGDRQAMGTIMNYALDKKATLGTASNKFIYYQTWPDLKSVDDLQDNHINLDTDGNGVISFSEYFESPYYKNGTDISDGVATPSRQQTLMLMDGVRSDFEGKDVTFNLAPVAEILSRLDTKIVNGTLPGIQRYFERNADYYLNSRNAGSVEQDDPTLDTSAFIPGDLHANAFVQKYGALNFYVDRVHLAAFPHNGNADGTLPSYICAITLYSIITGNSPIGLPVDLQTVHASGNYGRMDPVEDAELIAAVQQTVYDVLVDEAEYTGFSADAPSRITPEKLIRNSFSTRDVNAEPVVELADSVKTKASGATVSVLNDYSDNNEMNEWYQKTLGADAKFDRAQLSITNNAFSPYEDWAQVKAVFTTPMYMMTDITDKVAAGNTYKLSIDVSNAIGKTGKLCLKLTKKDGSVETRTIAQTDCLTNSDFYTIKGNYVGEEDVVKTEVYIDFALTTAPDESVTTSYYFDNFELIKIGGDAVPTPVAFDENIVSPYKIQNSFSKFDVYGNDLPADTITATNSGTAVALNNYNLKNTEMTTWYPVSLVESKPSTSGSVGTAADGTYTQDGGIMVAPYALDRLVLMNDVTNYLRATDTYKFTVKLKGQGTGKMAKLCLRLTKKDSTVEIKDLLTTDVTGTYTNYSADYTYPSDVAKAEFFVKMVSAADPATSTNDRYYMSEFEMVKTATGDGTDPEPVGPTIPEEPEVNSIVKNTFITDNTVSTTNGIDVTNEKATDGVTSWYTTVSSTGAVANLASYGGFTIGSASTKYANYADTRVAYPTTDVTTSLIPGHKYNITALVNSKTDLDKLSAVIRYTKPDGTYTDTALATNDITNGVDSTINADFDYAPATADTKSEIILKTYDSTDATTAKTQTIYLYNFELIKLDDGTDATYPPVVDPTPDPEPEPEPEPEPDPANVLSMIKNVFTFASDALFNNAVNATVDNQSATDETSKWYSISYKGGAELTTSTNAAFSAKAATPDRMGYVGYGRAFMATNITSKLVSGEKYNVSVTLTNGNDCDKFAIYLRLNQDATTDKVVTVANVTKGIQTTINGSFTYEPIVDVTKAELILKAYNSSTYATPEAVPATAVIQQNTTMYSFELTKDLPLTDADLTLALTSALGQNIALDVTNPNSVAKSGTILVATYDKNYLTGFKMLPIELAANETKPITTTIPMAANYLITVVNNTTDFTPMSLLLKNN